MRPICSVEFYVRSEWRERTVLKASLFETISTVVQHPALAPTTNLFFQICNDSGNEKFHILFECCEFFDEHFKDFHSPPCIRIIISVTIKLSNCSECPNIFDLLHSACLLLCFHASHSTKGKLIQTKFCNPSHLSVAVSLTRNTQCQIWMFFCFSTFYQIQERSLSEMLYSRLFDAFSLPLAVATESMLVRKT